MKTPEEYFNDQIELPDATRRDRRFTPSEHEFLQKYLGMDHEELLRKLDLGPAPEGPSLARVRETSGKVDLAVSAPAPEPAKVVPGPGASAQHPEVGPVGERKSVPPQAIQEQTIAQVPEQAVPGEKIAASQSAAPTTAGVTDLALLEELQLVSFMLGDQEFALPILEVQEVIRRVEPVKLPTAPRFMVGIVNLRGRVTPIIHLGVMLGKDGVDQQDCGFVVVCRHDDFQIGLLVSRVVTMYRMARQSIEWNIDAHLGGNVDLLVGLIKNDDRLIGIVDVGRLVNRVLKRTGESNG